PSRRGSGAREGPRVLLPHSFRVPVVPDGPFGWAAAAGAAAHLFVDAVDDEVTVDGPDGHHLQRVRRLRAGEGVTASPGAGTWRRYDVTRATDGSLDLQATGDVVSEPAVTPRVSVAVSLTKGGSLDDLIASCTELGVDRIEPVRAARSVVRWDDGKARAA